MSNGDVVVMQRIIITLFEFGGSIFDTPAIECFAVSGKRSGYQLNSRW